MKADIDPVSIDRSITFKEIGGLKNHIVKLKEMIILPLLYPSLYDQMGIRPPRGVLFVGPPGTGKTLMARALCNLYSTPSDSSNHRKGGYRNKNKTEIAFFMRKGADILSKWVGEAEKQLRLLFEKAKELEPSIIFFDEIDGLAPCRSSKQDYIHSSIVSTLLALMDGLNDRGNVIVIGATNRVDAIDDALRRPGRFDREFYFSLPNETERKQILDIHTRKWSKKKRTHSLSTTTTTPTSSSSSLNDSINMNINCSNQLKKELAKKTVGFCGADLKSLCTETALTALRRQLPELYEDHEEEKRGGRSLNLGNVSITIERKDWMNTLKAMTPSFYKSKFFYGRPLEGIDQIILQDSLTEIKSFLSEKFPFSKNPQTGKIEFIRNQNNANNRMKNMILMEDEGDDEADDEDDEDDEVVVVEEGKESSNDENEKMKKRKRKKKKKKKKKKKSLFGQNEQRNFLVYRPSLLIYGSSSNGQNSLLESVLYDSTFESFPVFDISFLSLFEQNSSSLMMMEDRLYSILRESKNRIRENGGGGACILICFNILFWWKNVNENCRKLLIHFFRQIQSNDAILFLATLESENGEEGEEGEGEVKKMEDEEKEEKEKSSNSMEDEEKEEKEEKNKELERMILRENKKKERILNEIPSELIDLFNMNYFYVDSPSIVKRKRIMDKLKKEILQPIRYSIKGNQKTKKTKKMEDEETESNEQQGNNNNNNHSVFSYGVSEEKKKQIEKRLRKEEKFYQSQLGEWFYSIVNSLLNDRHLSIFHRPKKTKRRGRRRKRGRGRGRRNGEYFFDDEYDDDDMDDFIVDDKEYNQNYERWGKKDFIPGQNPSAANAHAPPTAGGSKSKENPNNEDEVPHRLIYLLDILENVVNGKYRTVKEFLKPFKFIKEYAMYYYLHKIRPESDDEEGDYILPGRGLGGGENVVLDDEEEYRKRRVMESGKMMYKKVKVMIQSNIEEELIEECDLIFQRREEEKKQEEMKKKKEEEELQKKAAQELREKEEKIHQQEELLKQLGPRRRVTRSITTSLEQKQKEGEDKKKDVPSLKIHLPKVSAFEIEVNKELLNEVMDLALEKSKNYSLEEFKDLISTLKLEILKYKTIKERDTLLLSLKSILNTNFE